MRCERYLLMLSLSLSSAAYRISLSLWRRSLNVCIPHRSKVWRPPACPSVCQVGLLPPSFLSVLHILVRESVVCVCVLEESNRSLSVVTHNLLVSFHVYYFFLNFLMRARVSKKREHPLKVGRNGNNMVLDVAVIRRQLCKSETKQW